MTAEQIEKLKEFLKAKADEDHPGFDDDFCADDVGGGNQDDAFYSGREMGEICFALDILKKFFNEPS